jgi:hypothetical protein
VVIEALRSEVPVLASRIPGNVGLLGRDYEGYFTPGDAPGLAALMQRYAQDVRYACRIAAQCAAMAPRYAPQVESAAVRGLIGSLLKRAQASAEKIVTFPIETSP